MKRLTLILLVLTGLLLFRAVADLPDWADPASPASLNLSSAFIERAYHDTHTPNIVTAVLADYRGYDTMFETVVVLAAGLIIMVILRRTPRKRRKVLPRRPQRQGRDIILRGAAQLLIPAMQIFALYVLAHGHYSPGGGFQGGVIFGASFILLALCHNLQFTLARFKENRLLLCCGIGVLIYAGIGLLCLLLGRNLLDYAALAQLLGVSEVMARSYGILGVEVGVGITVMAIMISLYYDLASGGDMDEGL